MTRRPGCSRTSQLREALAASCSCPHSRLRCSRRVRAAGARAPTSRGTISASLPSSSTARRGGARQELAQQARRWLLRGRRASSQASCTPGRASRLPATGRGPSGARQARGPEARAVAAPWPALPPRRPAKGARERSLRASFGVEARAEARAEALQKLCRSSAEALQKRCRSAAEALQKLCRSSCGSVGRRYVFAPLIQSAGRCGIAVFLYPRRVSIPIYTEEPRCASTAERP